MSIVVATHGEEVAPRWTDWDETALEAPQQGFIWIDVVDAEGESIGKLQRVYGLHELAVEDSMSTTQFAKVNFLFRSRVRRGQSG